MLLLDVLARLSRSERWSQTQATSVRLDCLPRLLKGHTVMISVGQPWQPLWRSQNPSTRDRTRAEQRLLRKAGVSLMIAD